MSLTRRQVIIGAACTYAATSLLPAWANVPWSSGTQRPRLAVPQGSVDCHMHLYDNRVPAVPGAKLRPANASLADYRLLQALLGIQRMVIVTPSTYGFDNCVMLEGLQQSHGNARGVAVVEADVADHTLEQLHTAGVRGVRFNLSFGGTRIEDLERLSARVNEHGWHVQFVSPGDALVQLEPRLSRLPGKLVIDHFGQIVQPGGIDSDAFKALQHLVDTGNVWVKASGAYNSSKAGAPTYQDVGSIAKALIAQRADRVLWGSDWPHPTVTGTKPDDAEMLDLLLDWAPSQKDQALILRDNAVALYGF